MKKIAEYKDIEELSRLRIMQQKDDWKELYPSKDEEFYNITKGYICDVFTLREYRKKGIQTNLIKECIKFAKENNIIELKLSSDNPNAIKIYKEQGFEYDKLMMKKEIEN